MSCNVVNVYQTTGRLFIKKPTHILARNQGQRPTLLESSKVDMRWSFATCRVFKSSGICWTNQNLIPVEKEHRALRVLRRSNWETFVRVRAHSDKTGSIKVETGSIKA